MSSNNACCHTSIYLHTHQIQGQRRWTRERVMNDFQYPNNGGGMKLPHILINIGGKDRISSVLI